MVELRPDSALTLNEARKKLPGRPSLSTMIRWANKGVLVRNQRICLDATRVGRRYFTDGPAIDRFLRAIQDADRAEADTPTPEPPLTHSRAEHSLREAGL